MALALAGAFAAAAVGAWLVTPGSAGRALALLVLALGAAAAWDRALLRGRRAPKAIELCADGRASVELRDGRRVEAGMGRRYVSRLAVIVGVRHALRRHLIVSGDMLDAEDFRRFRQWALWCHRRQGHSSAGG